MKKTKTTKFLLKSWNKYLLNESIKLDQHYEDREDYEDSGFQIEDEENFLDIAASDRKETGLHGGYDEEKTKRLSSFDSSGINVGIKSIIDRLESKVINSRTKTGDENIKGRIYLYENEFEGFIKYNFDDLLPEGRVNSTLEFESTPKDWVMGYGLGAYRHMLTHKSTKGVSALIFEIMLEFVSIIRGKSLVSDRYSITPQAQKKWHVYANRNDVDLIQLDMMPDEAESYNLEQLTPEAPEDDISQKFSLDYFGEDWTNSVFSKAFKKTNMDVIKYLIDSPYIELVFSINNESDLTSKISL
jgi:hypothetical protein